MRNCRIIRKKESLFKPEEANCYTDISKAKHELDWTAKRDITTCAVMLGFLRKLQKM